jgi:hypothetical protein
VTGSKVVNISMFDSKGKIPKFILDFIVKRSTSAIKKLCEVAKLHEKEYLEYSEKKSD